MIATVSGIEDAHRLADTIASHMTLSLEQKQEILEVSGLSGRLEHLMGLMESENWVTWMRACLSLTS